MFRSLALSLLLVCQAHAAGTKITIVIGDKAPPMDRQAAEQLSRDLGLLFEADPTVQTTSPSMGAQVLLVGNPSTNPAISSKAMPMPAEQGYILKSTDKGLIVGGGSPLATLWAASELSSRFGIRHLLHGDVMPVEKPALKLDGWDVAEQPSIKTRHWSMFNGTMAGGDSWPAVDLKTLFQQLVKLKFTHIDLPATMASITPIPVDGDTGGRKAFGGAKLFPIIETNRNVRSIAEECGLQVATESEPEPQPSILPQGDLTLWAPLLAEASAKSAPSVTVSASNIGDVDALAMYISEASFHGTLDKEKALAVMVTPICGEGVADRVSKAFGFVAKANELIATHDKRIGVIEAGMMLRHLHSKEALPEWITEAKTLYSSAMSEMYRANTRARGGARSYTLYHAKRMEFSFHYFTALEALYKAHDKAARADAMEAAVEAAYNALNAYADVARDQSDRGTIALLNEYGYRALANVKE